MSAPGTPRRTIIDLFAGVGGMSLGAARAGFDVCAAVELDSIAIGTHARNFPASKHLEWDVGALTGNRLLEAAGLRPGQLDGLVGGPPCQGFSEIGKKAVNDPRNSLFGHFFRLVAETRPKFFVAENVPGIGAGRNSGIVEKALAQIPDEYVVLPATEVPAFQLGAPTSRARMFFIGYDPRRINALTVESVFEPRAGRKVTVGDALIGLPTIRSDWQREDQGWRFVETDLDDNDYFYSRLFGSIPPGVGSAVAIKQLQDLGRISGNLGTRHTDDVIRRFRSVQPGSTDSISRATRLSADGFCPTLRAGTASDRGSFQAVRPIHHKSPRVISPREAARLQGFPDWFQFHATKWHSFRQIGNSVSPLVAEALLERIYNKLR